MKTEELRNKMISRMKISILMPLRGLMMRIVQKMMEMRGIIWGKGRMI